MCSRYLESGQTLYGIAKWLRDTGVAAPRASVAITSALDVWE